LPCLFQSSPTTEGRPSPCGGHTGLGNQRKGPPHALVPSRRNIPTPAPSQLLTIAVAPSECIGDVHTACKPVAARRWCPFLAHWGDGYLSTQHEERRSQRIAEIVQGQYASDGMSTQLATFPLHTRAQNPNRFWALQATSASQGGPPEGTFAHMRRAHGGATVEGCCADTASRENADRPMRENQEAACIGARTLKTPSPVNPSAVAYMISRVSPNAHGGYAPAISDVMHSFPGTHRPCAGTQSHARPPNTTLFTAPTRVAGQRTWRGRRSRSPGTLQTTPRPSRVHAEHHVRPQLRTAAQPYAYAMRAARGTTQPPSSSGGCRLGVRCGCDR
jgi:hypothetical protein